MKKYKIEKDIPDFIGKNNIVTKQELLKWFTERGIEILSNTGYISNVIIGEVKFIGKRICLENNTRYSLLSLYENIKRLKNRNLQTVIIEVESCQDIDSHTIESIEIIAE